MDPASKASRLLWRRHRAGSNPTPAKLIKARRYTEASLAIRPEDHDARIALALHREGPLPDLLLAARHRSGATQADASEILYRIYPGEQWGFAKWQSRQAGDPLSSAFAAVRGRAARRYLKSAAALARRILRSYPEADSRHQTLLDLACIEVLRGRTKAARALTVKLANSDAPHYLRDQGSRVSQRINSARRQGNTLNPVIAASTRLAPNRLTSALETTKRRKPLSPSDIRDLFMSPDIEVSERVLDAATIAACIGQEHEIWVGVLNSVGFHCAPVVGIETTARVVLFGDGTLTEWDALERSSVWGARMMVVHAAGKPVPGESPSISFVDIPCPRFDNGEIDARLQTLSSLRASSRKLDKVSLASFNYAVALEQSANGEAGAVYDGAEHRRHLAWAAARFPGVAWPLMLLARRFDPGGDERPGALLTIGLAGTMPTGNLTSYSRAMFSIDNADALIRDELVVSKNNFKVLRDAAYRAAARRDGTDFDTHLDMLQRCESKNTSLPFLRQVREVVWHGPDAALPVIEGAPSDPGGAYAKLRLAANTGRADLLRTYSDPLAQGGHRREVRDASVLLAMHTGSYELVLEAVQAVVATDGLGDVISRSLADAAEILAPPDDVRLIDTLDFAISSGDSGVLNLTGDLLMRRLSLAIAILRAKVGRPGDPTDVHMRLARALIHQASRAPSAASEAIAREALASLAEVDHVRSNLLLWECFQAAAWRHIDPDRSFHILTRMERLGVPFVAFSLAAAVSAQRGDDELASRMVARAANAELIRAGIASAVYMGVDHQIDLAFEQTDLAVVREEAWGWFGADGHLPSLPRLPRYGEAKVTERTLWRLIDHREFDLAERLHAHRWNPEDFLTFGDGASRVAIASTISAMRGDTTALAEALSTSRHPAYLRAASTCERAGIDVGRPIAPRQIGPAGWSGEATQ